MTDDFAALVGLVRGLDGGDWAGADLERLAGELGGTLTGSNSGSVEIAAAGLPTGRAHADRDEDAPDRYRRLSIPTGSSAPFHELVAAATDVFGHPPPMLGGDRGVWARWRGARTSVELSHHARFGNDLVLLDTVHWEDAARREFNGGEGVSYLPYRWLATERHPSLAGLTTGGRIVHDWTEMTTGLASTIHGLLTATTALDTYASVSLHGRRGGLRLDVYRQEVIVGEIVETATRTGWPAAGEDDCAAAAELVAGRLRDEFGAGFEEGSEGDTVGRPVYADPSIGGGGGERSLELPGLGLRMV